MQELEKGRIASCLKDDGRSSFAEQWFALWDASQQWLITLLDLCLHLALRSPALRAFLCFLGLHTLCASAQYSSAAANSHLRDSSLLPPRSCRDGSKLTVVLDLDETLVCAYDSQGLPPFLHSQAVRSGVHWFQLQCVAVDEKDGKQKTNNVIVYERPGLQEFLSRTSKFAEIVIFTAGLEAYASPLIHKIDPEKKVSTRLYRPATVVTKYKDQVHEISCHVKDLSCLGRDLRRTVIIDNNPFSFILQPNNGIPCVPFTGEDPQDHQLLQVLLPLLERLSSQKDVRTVLDNEFRMAAWFRSVGVPVVG